MIDQRFEMSQMFEIMSQSFWILSQNCDISPKFEIRQNFQLNQNLRFISDFLNTKKKNTQNFKIRNE